MNVFPIKAGAKFPPLIKGWQQAASPREQWAKDGWSDDYNWGVHCAGMIVVDVDPKNGGDESFFKLEIEHDFPQTRTVRTPSGGLHLYYSLPTGHPGVANRPLAPGIDIKSTGGYVVAAGSKTEAGTYVGNETPTVQAPDWLIEKCGTARPQVDRAAPIQVPDAPPGVVEKAREWIKTRPQGDEAYKTACGLRDFGLSEGQALQMLWWHDGRPDTILSSKVRHAYEYARGEPGAAVATEADFEVVTPVPAPKPKHGPQRVKAVAQGIASRRPYLVKGMLQRGAYALLYGAPGEGKTFVALDIAYHVAAGLDWMGCKVKQGPVLYLAYEGQGGLAARAAALVASHGAELDVPLYIQPAGYRFNEPIDRKSLAETVAGLPEKPALIVIDTLARAALGWDENSAADMSEFNKVVADLMGATGAMVMVVHHSGKNQANGARGSSALLGAIDTELEIRDGEIRSTKQRDMEEKPPVYFKLARWEHPFETDEDGDAITSCTVEIDVPKAGVVWTEAYTLGVLSRRIKYADLRDAVKEATGWGKTKVADAIGKEPKIAHDKTEVWYVEVVDST